MLKTLWLVSWYPTVAIPQNGDFIQRHAESVAPFAEVYIIHTLGVSRQFIKSSPEIIFRKNGNLSEKIILYRSKGKSVWRRIHSICQYISLYKKAINQYIKENGKPDIVHVHVGMNAGLIALWLKKKYGIPYIITEHSSLFNPLRPQNFRHAGCVFKYLTRKVFKNAKWFLPVSNSLGLFIKKYVIYRSFSVIPNVVDTNRFKFSPIENLDVFTFLHVSSLDENKNPKGIIRAFARVLDTHKKVHLKLIGRVDENLMLLAQQLGISDEAISFLPQIANQEVAKEMKSAQVFLLFSFFENLPCVIAESLCCGVPVIATRVGGISEMIRHSNGLLVSAGDEDELAKAMIQIFDQYHTYNRKAISEDAIAKYNYDKVGKEIVAVYEKVLGK